MMRARVAPLAVLPLAAVLALLAACDAAPDREAPPAPPAGTASPTQASIMRPDVAPKPTTPALEPLAITIGFPDGGSDLAAAEVARLETLLASPQVAQGGPIRLGAHSDSAGTDDANLRASQQRGEAVRDWLIGKGITESRIALVSFGEQNPVRPNALPDGTPDEAGRAANRRVEIAVPVSAPQPAETREQTLAEEIGERTAPTGDGGNSSAGAADKRD